MVKASRTPIRKTNKKPEPNMKQKSVSTTRRNKKEKKNPTQNGNSGGLDEKGNPLPIEDPEGGSDPICPGGYKIDYDFDPFNDPINPPFRCISALKDPSDGITGNVTDIKIPSSGGKKTKRMRRRNGRRQRTHEHRRKK